MPLSSASTTEQVLAAYADNGSFDLNDSVDEAKAFIAACRLLLSPQHSVARSATGAAAVDLNQEVIERRLTDAQAWLAARSSRSGAVIHADFTGFRD